MKKLLYYLPTLVVLVYFLAGPLILGGVSFSILRFVCSPFDKLATLNVVSYAVAEDRYICSVSYLTWLLTTLTVTLIILIMNYITVHLFKRFSRVR